MRQGDIITELPARLTKHDLKTCFLIITHCCSLARKDPIELLPCQPLSIHDGMMTRGKNPRKLHFLIGTQWYEIEAHKKILCESKQIESAKLLHSAQEDERVVLQHWLASGYRRQALDDATGDMIKRLNLSTLTKDYGTDLLGIWVSGEPWSDTNSTLLCDIYFVFDSEADFSCHIEKIKNHIDRKAKEEWKITTFVIGDDDFTYRQARNFNYINFDYLSPDSAPIP